MSTYKLTYFNVRGRAETARFLFAQSGTKYEDERIGGQDWQNFKPKTPMGQMPVLSVDGVMFCQTKTIGRLLAKRFNLAGKNDIEQAQADMIVDCLDDVGAPLMKVFGEKDEAKKAELKKNFFEEVMPVSLAKLEKILAENSKANCCSVGDGVTWADFSLFNSLDFLTAMGAKIDYDKLPRIKAIKEMVEALPKIAEWIKARPESTM